MPIGIAMPLAGHDAVAFQHKNMTNFDQKYGGCCSNPAMSVFSTYFNTCTCRVVEARCKGSGAGLAGASRNLMVASSHADVKRIFTLGKP